MWAAGTDRLLEDMTAMMAYVVKFQNNKRTVSNIMVEGPWELTPKVVLGSLHSHEPRTSVYTYACKHTRKI